MSLLEGQGSDLRPSSEKPLNLLQGPLMQGQQNSPFQFTAPQLPASSVPASPISSGQNSGQFSFGASSTLTPQQQMLLANALQYSGKFASPVAARQPNISSNPPTPGYTAPIVTSPNSNFYYTQATTDGTAFSSNEESVDNYEDDEISESVDGNQGGSMDHLANAALGDGSAGGETGAARYMDITPFLNMPQSQAAKRLGIPTSTLSKRWKEAVRNRKWPYRTISKLDKEIMTLLHNIPQSLNSSSDDTILPAEIEATLGHLLRKRLEELRSVVIRIN